MITHETWRKALQEVEVNQMDPDDPAVVTTQEFMALIGCNRVTAALKLRKLIEAGKAVLTKKTIRRQDGGIQTVPAYRLREDDGHPTKGTEPRRRGSRARTGRR